MSNTKLEKNFLSLYNSDKEFIHKYLQYNLEIPLDVKNSNNDTLLHLMIKNNDYYGIDLLFDYINTSCSSSQKSKLLDAQNNQLNTPIHIAVKNDQQNVAERLHKMGATMGIPNNEDFMVLMSDDNSKVSQHSDSKHSVSRHTVSQHLESNFVKQKKTKNEISNGFIDLADLTVGDSDSSNFFIINNGKINNSNHYLVNDNDGNTLNFNKNTNRNTNKNTQIKDSFNEQSMELNNDIGDIYNKLSSNLNNGKVNNNNRNLNDYDIGDVGEMYDNMFMRSNNRDTDKLKNLNVFTSENEKTDTVSTDGFIEFIKKNGMINKNQSGGVRDNINGVRKINKTINDLFNEDSVNMTSDSLGIANILQNKSQIGGRKKKSKSSKLSRKSSKNSRSSKKSSSRSQRPSSDIHIEVVDIIKKMGYSEEDARFIKAGLYQSVKDKFPDVSNVQKALKLKEKAENKDEVKKMAAHLPKLKEIVTKAREQRKNDSLKGKEEKESKKSTKKEAKESKKSTNKESKESKKTSKRMR
jgi:hypothetical protein